MLNAHADLFTKNSEAMFSMSIIQFHSTIRAA